jgi:hypothetical protein
VGHASQSSSTAWTWDHFAASTDPPGSHVLASTFFLPSLFGGPELSFAHARLWYCYVGRTCQYRPQQIHANPSQPERQIRRSGGVYSGVLDCTCQGPFLENIYAVLLPSTPNHLLANWGRICLGSITAGGGCPPRREL